MYLDSLENVIPGMSTKGATSVGVPGTIAGIFEVHEKFGMLSIEEIFEPVIALVENGVVVTEKQAQRLDRYWDQIREVNGDNTLFYSQCIAGDTLRYPALANTLRRIAKNGRDEFYKGETAKKYVFSRAKERQSEIVLQRSIGRNGDYGHSVEPIIFKMLQRSKKFEWL